MTSMEKERLLDKGYKVISNVGLINFHAGNPTPYLPRTKPLIILWYHLLLPSSSCSRGILFPQIWQKLPSQEFLQLFYMNVLPNPQGLVPLQLFVQSHCREPFLSIFSKGNSLLPPLLSLSTLFILFLFFCTLLPDSIYLFFVYHLPSKHKLQKNRGHWHTPVVWLLNNNFSM